MSIYLFIWIFFCKFASKIECYMEPKQVYRFDSPEKEEWLAGIQHIRETYCAPNWIRVILDGKINRSNFTCFHFVTFSCIVDMCSKAGGKVILNALDTELHQYIINDVRLRKYWRDEEETVFTEPEQKPFNLWRIDEKYYANYSMALNRYFERTYFEGKDLTGLNNCVAELFQNILDHAQARGNAFFAIYYHEEKKEIEIAICDFGVGIPYTLRDQYPDSLNALQRSLLPGVSARTHKHNRGYGLDNIVSAMTPKDTLRIISDDAFLSKSQNKEEVVKLPYEFKGTLIDFTISTDSFDDLEIIDELNFG